jgi:hypothetical protein
MDDATILTEVKKRLAITDTFHDDMLSAFIDDTKDYLRAVGITDALLSDKKSLGILTRGVVDLWNNKPSDGSFSQMFYQRAIQLRAEVLESEE